MEIQKYFYSKATKKLLFCCRINYEKKIDKKTHSIVFDVVFILFYKAHSKRFTPVICKMKVNNADGLSTRRKRERDCKHVSSSGCTFHSNFCLKARKALPL